MISERSQGKNHEAETARDPAAEPVVRLEGVCRAFNGKEVLRGIDLEVFHGNTEVVVGKSGEGKSVLLKHINGLIRPDRGSVYVDGEEISAYSEKALGKIRRKVGMVFQLAALFDSMTVRENVGFLLDQDRRYPPREITDLVEQELRRVKLDPGILNKRPAELSGGMRKRVGLARTLITRPKAVLYDEPTTGLDPITADAINELILAMQAELGVTSIVVTHDMASAFKVGNHISLLHQGKLIYHGSVDAARITTDPAMKQFIEGRARGPIGEA